MFYFFQSPSPVALLHVIKLSICMLPGRPEVVYAFSGTKYALQSADFRTVVGNHLACIAITSPDVLTTYPATISPTAPNINEGRLMIRSKRVRGTSILTATQSLDTWLAPGRFEFVLYVVVQDYPPPRFSIEVFHQGAWNDKLELMLSMVNVGSLLQWSDRLGRRL